MYNVSMNLIRNICSLLFTVALISCSPVQNGSSSDSKENEDEIISQQAILWDDCLSQEEDRYLVFFHSSTCNQCHEIMGDVVSFAKSNITKTYFLNIDNQMDKVRTCSREDLTIGAESVDDLAILGTPTIIEVEDGMTIANVPGKDMCLTFLNEQRTKYAS